MTEYILEYDKLSIFSDNPKPYESSRKFKFDSDSDEEAIKEATKIMWEKCRKVPPHVDYFNARVFISGEKKGTDILVKGSWKYDLDGEKLSELEHRAKAE
ncbi:MAG: hypothetical protein WDZ77_03345 [Candidatus Pacearchaeota archaeon]